MDETNTRCIVQPQSSEAKAASVSTMSLVGFTISMNLVTSIINFSSAQSMVSIINMIQILILLPLTGAYIPLIIIQYFLGMQVCLFNFDFVSIESFRESKFVVNYVSYEQTNSYLYLIGLESESSAINLLNIFGLFLFLPPFHIIVWIIYKCAEHKNEKT